MSELDIGRALKPQAAHAAERTMDVSIHAQDKQARLARSVAQRLSRLGQELLEQWSIPLHHSLALQRALAQETGSEPALARLFEQQLTPSIDRELRSRLERKALPVAIVLCENAPEGVYVDYVADVQRLAEIRLALAAQSLAKLAARLLAEATEKRRSAAYWAAAVPR